MHKEKREEKGKTSENEKRKITESKGVALSIIKERKNKKNKSKLTKGEIKVLHRSNFILT